MIRQQAFIGSLLLLVACATWASVRADSLVLTQSSGDTVSVVDVQRELLCRPPAQYARLSKGHSLISQAGTTICIIPALRHSRHSCTMLMALQLPGRRRRPSHPTGGACCPSAACRRRSSSRSTKPAMLRLKGGPTHTHEQGALLQVQCDVAISLSLMSSRSPCLAKQRARATPFCPCAC